MCAQILELFSKERGEKRLKSFKNEMKAKTVQERNLDALAFFKHSVERSNYDPKGFLISDIWQVYVDTMGGGIDFALEAVRFSKRKFSSDRSIMGALKYVEMCVLIFNEFLTTVRRDSAIREIFLDFIRLISKCGPNELVILEAIRVLKSRSKYAYEAEKCFKAFQTMMRRGGKKKESFFQKEGFSYKSEQNREEEALLNFKIQCFGQASGEEIASLFLDIFIQFEGKESVLQETILILKDSNKKYLETECKKFLERSKKVVFV